MALRVQWLGWISLVAVVVLLKACPASPGDEPSVSTEPTVTAETVTVETAPQEPNPPEARVEQPPAESSLDEGTAVKLHPLMKDVDKTQYEKHLNFMSKPRSPGTEHWQKTQDYCAAQFKQYGYQVELHKYKTGVNVIGVKEGTTLKDERILVSAHYDSVPNCEGADDNASGTAGVLEAARVLAKQSHQRTLVVACWDEEERGLLGSIAYATRVVANKETIKMHFVLEMIGYYSEEPNSQTLPTGLNLLFPDEAKAVEDNQFRGDFVALIGDTGALPAAKIMTDFGKVLGLSTVTLTVPDSLKTSPLIRDLRRSDHAPYWSIDVPAMMVTDTSEFRYKPYHCRNGAKDSIEKLNADFSTQIIQVTVGAAATLLSPNP